MKPYYKDTAVEFYNEDCVSGMNQLPEGLYHGLVTSPPYAIGKAYEEDQSFGSYLKLLADFLEAGYRLTMPGGYAIINYADFYMFAGQDTRVQPMQYLYHLIAERVGWVHKCTRIWQKDFASLVDPYTISGLLPKLEAEWISTFRKPGGKREKIREQDLHPRAIWSTAGIRQPKATLKDHPAAYPEALVTMIFKVYADPGDTWIDPFLGNGTTLAVAKKMGIKGVGFEMSKEYCELCRLRLEQQVFDFDGVFQEKQIPAFLSNGEPNVTGQVDEIPI